MTSTLTPACSLCGLRFENGPLLELHLREDHPQRGPTVEPGEGNPAGAPALHPRSAASGHVRRPANSHAKAGTSIIGPGRPRRGRTGWATTGLRRIIGAFRHANAELLFAAELMLHPPGPPRPRRPSSPPAELDAHQAALSGRADRAA
jgi:hypothetical protein